MIKKYKTDEVMEDMCITPCLHQSDDTMVGSVWCRGTCKHCFGWDMDKKFVDCRTGRQYEI